MSTMASQIANITVVYSNVYPGADQRKHQSSVSMVFVWGIHRLPVNSSHKWPVTRNMFPFDDVIMLSFLQFYWWVFSFSQINISILSIVMSPSTMLIGLISKKNAKSSSIKKMWTTSSFADIHTWAYLIILIVLHIRFRGYWTQATFAIGQLRILDRYILFAILNLA